MKHFRILYRYGPRDSYEMLTDGDKVAENTEEEAQMLVEAILARGIHPQNIEIIEVEDVI